MKPNGYNLTKGGDNSAINILTPVCAYDYYGNLIESFDSIVDAAKWCNGDPCVIRKNCVGKCSYAYHYIWRYKDDNFEKYEIKTSKKRIDSGRSIAIDMYDLNGDYLRSFNSAGEASNHFNCSRSHIVECCKKQLKTYFGYIWRFDGENIDIKESIKSNIKSVVQYSIDGEELNRFASISDANKYLGKNIKSTNICKCCKGINKTAYGYLWRYEN